MVDSDRELLSLIAFDDVTAFKKLYHRYWDVLIRQANAKLRDISASEDLVQDLFVELWNKRKTITVHTSVKNYLFTAVKYQVYRIIDEQYRSTNLEEALVDVCEEERGEVLAFEELYQQIEVVIERLPKRQREIFRLSKFGQLSAREIAQRLNIAPQTVNNKIHQSLSFIKAELKHFILMLILCWFIFL